MYYYNIINLNFFKFSYIVKIYYYLVLLRFQKFVLAMALSISVSASRCLNKLGETLQSTYILL